MPERALVRVHYNGYLEYADEPYDSSRLRGKQQQFVLGNGNNNLHTHTQTHTHTSCLYHVCVCVCVCLCWCVGEVIPGWEVAVLSMRRNERSQYLISPEYAFGQMGCPPRIPPNATSMSTTINNLTGVF